MKALVMTLALSCLALSARAAEFYPKQISLRTFGTDQGNVGDCQTAAEIGALEGAFANRGRGFVKLSLFYRHAVNWAGKPANPGTMLDLNAADLAFIQKAGPLLPDYMWPEDGEGYDPRGTGVRPHPSEAVVWDPAFPSAASMGFSRSWYTFEPGYSNTSSLDGLKANVAAGNAVVLSLHGDLFQGIDPRLQWDHVTGFLKQPYSWATLIDALAHRKLDAKTGIDHAMMVVGFDDSLYADQGYRVPGALIVRNSWNDSGEVAAAMAHPAPEQQALLPKMRLKVYSQNLPGFYALPYQYVLDMMANRTGGFDVLNLDYAAFAAKYQALSSRYRTVRAPFVCDEALGMYRSSDPARRKVQAFGASFRKLQDAQLSSADRAEASRVTYQMALNEVASRTRLSARRPVFRYALLARHDGLKQNRADDFYAGKFRGYYCGTADDPKAGVWPNTANLASPALRDAIDGLSENGSTPLSWYAFLHSLSDTL
jgi:hypothetical protein